MIYSILLLFNLVLFAFCVVCVVCIVWSVQFILHFIIHSSNSAGMHLTPSETPSLSKIHLPLVFLSILFTLTIQLCLTWLEPSMALRCLRRLQKWLLMSMCKGYCMTLPTATSSISFSSPPREPVQRFMQPQLGTVIVGVCGFFQPRPFVFTALTHNYLEVSSPVKLFIKHCNNYIIQKKNNGNMQKQLNEKGMGIQAGQSKPL